MLTPNYSNGKYAGVCNAHVPGKDYPSQPCPDAKLTDAVLISIKGGVRKAVQKRKDAIAHWVADSNRHTGDTAGIQPWQLIQDQITVIIRGGVRQGLALQWTEQEYNLFYSVVEMITTHIQYWICYYCLFLTPSGWPITNSAPVPVHWLARARRAQIRGGLHRFHRPSAQNQGAVWPRRTNQCSLQVIKNRFLQGDCLSC